MAKFLVVDRGSYCVRIVEVEKTLRGYKISRLIEQPVNRDFWFPSNPLSFRQIEEEIHHKHFDEQIDEAVKSALEINGLSSSDHKVASHIGPNSFSSRFLDWPAKEKKKAPQTVALNLEDELPFDTDTTFSDVSFLPSLKTDPKPICKILAGFIPKDNFQKFIQRRQPIDPDFLTVPALAFAGLAKHHQTLKNSETVTALVDIGHYYTSVVS